MQSDYRLWLETVSNLLLTLSQTCQIKSFTIIHFKKINMKELLNGSNDHLL